MKSRYASWRSGIILALAVVVASVAQTNTVFAQTTAEQATGMSGEALRSLLRSRMSSSGMSMEQVRQRLAELGYDPNMLNAYLTDAAAPPQAGNDAVAAARALGALELPSSTTSANTPAVPAAVTPPVELPRSEEEKQEGLRVFGTEVFSRGTAQFQPVTSGPVPGSYVLGPGDEIILIITGDVEMVHTLQVTREGFIVVPQVGQIWVNGVTLDSFREQMYTYLGRVYSGISRGGNASTRFDVSLGRLRTNQVFITGSVAQPGTYLLSPIASVLNGLYQAGGPTAEGSFRNIQIMRGGRVVQSIDLYDYLLRGNNLDEIRLAPSDVIFVPPAGAHIALRGTVRREAIYELKPDETLADLLRFAGGPTTPADLRRARITRVLSPRERVTPGVDRTVIDVDLMATIENPASAPRLRDQDEVQIFAVRNEVRNTISLNGSVWREGSFAYRPGMRTSDLISLGDGLTPDAYLDRAHISRINVADSTLSIIPFSLARGPDGRQLEDPVLQEFDVVRVFSKAAPMEAFPVAVSGAVKNPTSERYHEGMTLRDLILRAGGLTRSSDMTVEISRLGTPAQREQGHIAQIYRVRLDSTYIMSDEVKRHYLGGQDSLAVTSGDAGSTFVLEPYDHVFVRTIPYLVMNRRVEVTGEVKYPGAYSLSSTTDRVRDIVVDRAGGLLETAYAEDISVIREGKRINVRFDEVLKNPRSASNMLLVPGDSIFVPEYDPTVRVTGGVEFPTTVLYKDGEGLDYYIKNAGGYSRYADEDRVSVRYANGGGEAVKNYLLMKTKPRPKPGSTVVVPVVPPAERDTTTTREIIKDMTQILATLGAAVIVVLRAN